MKTFDEVIEASKNQKTFPLPKKKESGKAKFYYWVGNKSGYQWGHTKEFKPKATNGERLKYMGWTEDLNWPKRMSTGRLLHNKLYELR